MDGGPLDGGVSESGVSDGDGGGGSGPFLLALSGWILWSRNLITVFGVGGGRFLTPLTSLDSLLKRYNL